LKVREFSREDERKLCIVFDNPAAGLVSHAAYEGAVNLAASLAWHFFSQDSEVSFLLPGHSRSADLHEFLARLAVIDPTAMSGDDVFRTLDAGHAGEYNIVLTARPRGSLPTALWNRSYFVFLGSDSKQ